MNEKNFFIAAAIGMIAAYALVQFTLIITDKISTILGIIQFLIGSFTWILIFFATYHLRKKLGLIGKNLLTKSIKGSLFILIISLTTIFGVFIAYIFWVSSLDNWSTLLSVLAFIIFLYLCFLTILPFYVTLKDLRHNN